jgi:peptidoglycan/xylan/chitin deacetylase (PgdA/CDA1 family)
MKEAALNLMRVAGAFAMFRLINRRRGLILTYHRFSKKEDGVSTSAAAFEEQLAYLTANYRLVPLSQMVEHLDGRGEAPPGLPSGSASRLPSGLPSGLVAITIDDGYRDAYEIAFPLLRRYGVPATLYVVTEFVERRAWLWTDRMRFLTARTESKELTIAVGDQSMRVTFDDERSRLSAAGRINSALKQFDDESKDETIERIAWALGVEIPETPPAEFAAVTWQEARQMDANGVEIGSHTLTHPILTRIDDVRLQRELNESGAELRARLGRSVEHFCYPNGDYDERVRGEVAKAGYRSAVTTVAGMVDGGDDLLSLRRIHTESDLTHFMQSTSGFEEAKGRLRRIARREASAQSSAGSASENAGKYRPVL